MESNTDKMVVPLFHTYISELCRKLKQVSGVSFEEPLIEQAVRLALHKHGNGWRVIYNILVRKAMWFYIVFLAYTINKPWRIIPTFCQHLASVEMLIKRLDTCQPLLSAVLPKGNHKKSHGARCPRTFGSFIKNFAQYVLLGILFS